MYFVRLFCFVLFVLVFLRVDVYVVVWKMVRLKDKDMGGEFFIEIGCN